MGQWYQRKPINRCFPGYPAPVTKSPCHADAKCRTNNGIAQCTCNEGFRGGGFAATGSGCVPNAPPPLPPLVKSVCAESVEGSGSPLNINCGSDYHIYGIEDAAFGLSSGDCKAFSADSSCNSDMAMPIVEEKCKGRQECVIEPDEHLFHSGCAAENKTLKARVVCVHRRLPKQRFGSGRSYQLKVNSINVSVANATLAMVNKDMFAVVETFEVKMINNAEPGISMYLLHRNNSNTDDSFSFHIGEYGSRCSIQHGSKVLSAVEVQGLLSTERYNGFWAGVTNDGLLFLGRGNLPGQNVLLLAQGGKPGFAQVGFQVGEQDSTTPSTAIVRHNAPAIQFDFEYLAQTGRSYRGKSPCAPRVLHRSDATQFCNSKLYCDRNAYTFGNEFKSIFAKDPRNTWIIQGAADVGKYAYQSTVYGSIRLYTNALVTVGVPIRGNVERTATQVFPNDVDPDKGWHKVGTIYTPRDVALSMWEKALPMGSHTLYRSNNTDWSWIYIVQLRRGWPQDNPIVCHKNAYAAYETKASGGDDLVSFLQLSKPNSTSIGDSQTNSSSEGESVPTKVCRCKEGYSGDGVAPCVKVNSCDIDHGNCSSNAECESAGPGQVQCVCKPGYKGDGYKCTSIDLCEGNHGHCDENAQCSMVGPGVRTCSCNAGFTGNGATCNCPNLCDVSNGGCDPNARCLFQGCQKRGCQCNSGFSGDGKTCAPLDACSMGSHNGGCDVNAKCTSSLNNGMPVAQCSCNSGYRGGGQICFVENSCTVSEMKQCHSNAVCNVVGGKPVCSCKSGYSGDGKTSCKCQNACASGSAGCHSNANCTSSGCGTATCQCKDGYRGDGRDCTPIDECMSLNGGCDWAAKCESTGPGKRRCTCYPPFTGDGLSCERISQNPYLPPSDNVCDSAANPCHPRATCTYAPPPGANFSTSVMRIMCNCNAGFSGNGIECDFVEPKSVIPRLRNTTSNVSCDAVKCTQPQDCVVGVDCVCFGADNTCSGVSKSATSLLTRNGCPEGMKRCPLQTNDDNNTAINSSTVGDMDTEDTSSNSACKDLPASQKMCGVSCEEAKALLNGNCSQDFVCRTSTGEHKIRMSDECAATCGCDSSPERPKPSKTACSFNNGGCSANADCIPYNKETDPELPPGIDTVQCRCKVDFYGNGIVCAPLKKKVVLNDVSRPPLSDCVINNGGCHPMATCSIGHTEKEHKPVVQCKCENYLGWTGNGIQCSHSKWGNDYRGFLQEQAASVAALKPGDEEIEETAKIL